MLKTLYSTLRASARPQTVPNRLTRLHSGAKRTFSTNPGNNFDEVMSSGKKKLPTTSIAIGLATVTLFGVYQFYSSNPQDKQTNSQQKPIAKPSVPESKEGGTEGKGSAIKQQDIDMALMLQESAREKFSADNYDDVIDLLEAALEILNNAKEGESVYSANIFFDLGFYHFHNNQIQKAREALNKAYELYNKGSHDEKGFDTLDLLALTYEKDPEGGEHVFEKIIQKRKEKNGETSLGLVKAYTQFGMWHIKNSKNDKGIECLRKAFKVLERVGKDPSNEQELGSIYNQLLNVYREGGATLEALGIAEKAIKQIDVKKFPEILKDVAVLYSEAGEQDDSIGYYRRYLEILRGSKKDDYEIGQILKNIAGEYEKKRTDEQALQGWREFSAFYNSFDSKEIVLMSIYGQLRAFALHNRRGRAKEAVKELEGAFNRAQELLGENHMYTKSLKQILRSYNKTEEPKLDVDALTLVLIALEDNLQKLVDTGFINV